MRRLAGVAVLVVASIILAVVKLGWVGSLSWGVVLAPLWLPFASMLVAVAVVIARSVRKARRG